MSVLDSDEYRTVLAERNNLYEQCKASEAHWTKAALAVQWFRIALAANADIMNAWADDVANGRDVSSTRIRDVADETRKVMAADGNATYCPHCDQWRTEAEGLRATAKQLLGHLKETIAERDRYRKALEDIAASMLDDPRGLAREALKCS